MIPFPTVFATAVVTNAPARFAIAAISTASRGESARVETRRRDRVGGVVEAVREVERERDDDRDDEKRKRSPVLDEDRLEDVGGVLARVDRLLELLVDVLPADDRQRVRRRSGRDRRSPRARAGRPRPRARAARRSCRCESL